MPQTRPAQASRDQVLALHRPPPNAGGLDIEDTFIAEGLNKIPEVAVPPSLPATPNTLAGSEEQVSLKSVTFDIWVSQANRPAAERMAKMMSDAAKAMPGGHAAGVSDVDVEQVRFSGPEHPKVGSLPYCLPSTLTPNPSRQRGSDAVSRRRARPGKDGARGQVFHTGYTPLRGVRFFYPELLGGNRKLRSVHKILHISATFGENSICFSGTITFPVVPKSATTRCHLAVSRS